MMVGERMESNHYPIIVNIERKEEKRRKQQQRKREEWEQKIGR